MGDILYSRESTALILSFVALQRARGASFEDAWNKALSRFDELRRSNGSWSFELEDVRALAAEFGR